MENYFQVIDGIKYDTGQATLLAESEQIIEEQIIDSTRTKIIKKFFIDKEVTEVFKKTKIVYYKHFYMYLGINHTYFLYVENIKESKELIDLNTETKEYKNVNKVVTKNIIPITRDKAIEYWFNGYEDWFNGYKFKPIVSEQEAFGEIPVA
jgi:hypothetical protein